MYKLDGTREEIKEWESQRAKQGFSIYDTYEINTWFMSIIPDMLNEIKKHPSSMRIGQNDLDELIKAFDESKPFTESEKKALDLFVKHFNELVW